MCIRACACVRQTETQRERFKVSSTVGNSCDHLKIALLFSHPRLSQQTFLTGTVTEIPIPTI